MENKLGGYQRTARPHLSVVFVFDFFAIQENKGEPVCRTRSTLKEVPPRDLTCRVLPKDGGFLLSAATMAVPTHFLVLRPLNHFSSASRCDGGS